MAEAVPPPIEPPPHIAPSFSERLMPWQRHRPGVASSLEVVEDYFGYDLDERVVAAARQLTRPQLHEVQGRLMFEDLKQHTALSVVAERRPKSTREVPRETRKHVPRELIEISLQSPSPPHAYIMEADQICVHEDVSLAPANPQLDLAEAGVLKHLALYCSHTLVRDPLTVGPWQADADYGIVPLSTDEWRNQFADGLRQLLDIAPLVRSGAFILFGKNPAIELAGSSEFNARRGVDPFVAWIVENAQPGLMDALWAVDAQEPIDLRIPRRYELLTQISAVLGQHYPYHLGAGELHIIRQMAQYAHRQPRLTMLTSRPAVVRHLMQSARVALHGQPDLGDMATASPSPFAMAAAYRLPSLSNVSFESIAKLRANEGVFEDVRTALTNLAEACANDAIPGNYEAYRAAVREHAHDIVEPVYGRLKRSRLITRLQKIGISAGSKGASLGFEAVTAPAAGTPLELGIENTLGKAADERYKATDLACRVLGSIMMY